MLERIKTGWNFQRIFFFAIGTLVVVQSLMSKHYLEASLGLYFAAIGLLGFGCAAGNCSTGPIQSKDVNSNKAGDNLDVTYEEIR
jgi:hypothetical protein